MISVLILTKNEEQDLPGCLESVAWSDDVHVLDSFSTDGTARIAEHHGAKVTRRVFDNYAAQRNAGLRQLAFTYEWLLILDADERIPVPLHEEMIRFTTSAPATVVAGRMRRRDFLGTTWLRRSQLSPYFIRLVRPARAHYEREVNEVLRIDGDVRELSEPFDHYPFSKGMAHWLAKHNVYSTMEAEQIAQARGNGERPSFTATLAAALTVRDFNTRRFHQKELFYRLPLRPLMKFVLMYFFRLGLLDGRAGFTYAALQAIYEYMIVLKTRELESRLPAPPRVRG